MGSDGRLGMRDGPRTLLPQRVRGGGVHVRRHAEPDDEAFDESLFFLLALVAGAVCGYLVAIG